jgi:hypothetical protein
MSRPISNTNIPTDTFQTFIARTNVLCDALTNEIVTANSTTGVTGNTTNPRNAQLVGAFSANTVAVVNGLRGGNTSSKGVLTIVSNTSVGAHTWTSAANSTYSNNQLFNGSLIANGATPEIKSGVLTISSNTTVSNTVSFGNEVTFQTDLVLDVAANTNIGANGASRVVYTYPKATYATAKFLMSAKVSGQVQLSEMIVSHNGTTAYSTVYGVVASPPGANNDSPLGTFSAAINSSNVEISMTPVYSDTAVKVVAHLIK